MAKPIIMLGRYRLSNDPELDLDALQRTVHLSPTVQGRAHTLRGVASNELDIVLTDDFEIAVDDRDLQVVEISRKSGKYDGKERDRIVLRRLPGHQARRLPSAELYTLGEDTGRVELVIESDGSVVWAGSYRRWTHELTDEAHAGDIVLWHWRRYYPFLAEAEVRAIAGAFGAEVIGRTLADANRLASRRLYALARESGYRKLTLREQRAWGLEGQWHHESRVAQARERRGHCTGTGEHTRLSAKMAEHLEGWLNN
jgi:hypothetical protein